MPKNETKEIQYTLKELGERLGFISIIEEQIHDNETYAPIYDVVWYLDLTKQFNFTPLEPLFKNNKEWLERLKKIPFAGFEIEGANTSSKNQLSNFTNLYCGNFLYNFVVVNNEGATKENDIYRRGIKLYRYFMDNCGDKNTFFLDKEHLYRSIEKLENTNLLILSSNKKTEERRTYGGEKKSVEIYEKIRGNLDSTGFIIKQNYSPEMAKVKFDILKNCNIDDGEMQFYLRNNYYKDPINKEIKKSIRVSDSFYIPKLDIVLGLYLPDNFKEWLKKLGEVLEKDAIQYTLLYALKKEILKEVFVPLISIEIEASINKHLNGGIYNM